VSCESRAGWSGGWFNAVKLLKSVSTSGPSAMLNPRRVNTETMSSITWVRGWHFPRIQGVAGRVRSRDVLRLRSIFSFSIDSCLRVRASSRSPFTWLDC